MYDFKFLPSRVVRIWSLPEEGLMYILFDCFSSQERENTIGFIPQIT